MFRKKKLLLIAFVIALWPLVARAQTPDPQPPGPAPDPERPALNPSPAEQNWSFLSDYSKRTDFFDPLKYILFGGNPNLYLSLGFEYRIEYEYDDNWMFGAGPQDHRGYVMNRPMPHFDFHAGNYIRCFPNSSLTSRTGGTVARGPISTKTAAMFIRHSLRLVPTPAVRTV
jgi:hypothetical protein